MLSPSEQLAVVRGLRGGDRGAWATLYDSYSEEVWRYAASLIGGDGSAVADLVQETFLEAARSARTFDPEKGTLWSWLAGIVHHRAAAHWRAVARTARLRDLAEAGEIEIRRLSDDRDSPVAAAERRELADQVRRVLAELPADYAALLTGKYLDERTLEELAEQCGGSVEAVKSKLARARREFREQFERLTKATTKSPAGR